MKYLPIRRFRFFRVIFFTLRLLLKYALVFFLRHFVPYFLYSRLLNRINRKTSLRLRNFFFKLQGIYIKAGQFISVVGNIFAPELTTYLKDLQDHVPPRPYGQIKPSFLQHWGTLPEDALGQFNPIPIASASLGQVYTGYHQGQKVAVKVLYPDIQKIIEKDLETLKTVLRLIELFFSGLELGMLYNEFTDMILKEIDFDYEKKHLTRLKDLLKHEKKVMIPAYIPELSKGSILVTEFIEGHKIDNLAELAAQGHDQKEIAQNLLDIYCEMIFKYGFFHSDPHPGNLIITPQGKIGIIDFGSADTLAPESIFIIRKLLKAFIFKDISMVVQHLEDIGFLKPTADKEELEKIAYFFIQRLLAFQTKDYQRMTLNEIYKLYNINILGIKFQQFLSYLQIPRNYLFLGRTIGILIGVASKLDPQMNIIQVLLPHLKKFLLSHNENLAGAIKEDIKSNVHYISQLPENIHKALETVNSGKIKVNLKELKQDFHKMYVLGHQFIYTLLFITSASLATVFHLHKEPGVTQILSSAAGFFATLLGLSFFRNRKK